MKFSSPRHTKESFKYIPDFLLGLYIFISQTFQFCTERYEWNQIKNIIFSICLTAALFFIIPRLHRQVSKIELDCQADYNNKTAIITFILFFLLSFSILFLWLLGCFPGSFSPDSINQIAQATNGKYNNWHPVLHTLIFFSLPLKITGTISAIILLQIVYFSLFIAFLALSLRRHINLCRTFLVIAAILLSPFTLNIITFPWKDVAFAITAAMCMIFSANIYFSNGLWIEKKRHLILFSVMLALSTIFRHNGLLFTLPLVASLCFFTPKKKWITLALLSILILFTIKIPLYSNLNISAAGDRVTETCGFPLSIITYVAKECPQCLDTQTAAFIEKMTEKDPLWKNFHDVSGFNSIKWKSVNTKVIEEYGRLKIISMAIKCFINSPMQSIKAVAGLTSYVYSVNSEQLINKYIQPNPFGITYNRLLFVEKAEQNYETFFYDSKIGSLFSCVGTTLIIMLSFAVFKTNLKNKMHIRRLLLCSPIYIYVFGTMLFLSGNEIRFFFVVQLIWPPILLILLKKESSHAQ